MDLQDHPDQASDPLENQADQDLQDRGESREPGEALDLLVTQDLLALQEGEDPLDLPEVAVYPDQEDPTEDQVRHLSLYQ